MKRKKYWAGFVNNQLDENEFKELHANYNPVYRPQIFIRKKDALKHYQDVRPIEIREIKK